MDFGIPYLAALLLGSMHALEADHMAAVTAFAIRRPAPLAAAGFGVRWAVGHGGALVATGILLLVLGLAIPEPATFWLDRAVGLVLIALGCWTLYSSGRLHAHVHHHGNSGAHVHLHSHATSEHHDHLHAATAIGALHGLAGAAPALAVLNIARTQSMVQGVSALLLFALGTAIGMALYALVAGLIAGHAAIASQRLARAISRISGLATICIGVFWLLR